MPNGESLGHHMLDDSFCDMSFMSKQNPKNGQMVTKNSKCLVDGSWNTIHGKAPAREFLGNLCNLTVIFFWTPFHDDTWMFACASTKQILKSRYLFRTASPSESQLFSYRPRAEKSSDITWYRLDQSTNKSLLFQFSNKNNAYLKTYSKMKVDGATAKKNVAILR